MAKKTITIKGKGGVAFHVKGELNRLPAGKPVEATDAQIAVLKRNGVAFTKN